MGPEGLSRERTFQQDLTSREEILLELDRLARETAEDVRKDGRPAVRIVVKVRLIPFITKTRGVALPAPTSAPEDLVAGARAALERFPTIERAVRLLGVRAEFGEQAAPSTGLGHPMLEISDPDADDG